MSDIVKTQQAEIDLLRRDIARQLAIATEQANEIEGLRAALGNSACPKPVNGHDTAHKCVNAGLCGCENGPLLGGKDYVPWGV